MSSVVVGEDLAVALVDTFLASERNSQIRTNGEREKRAEREEEREGDAARRAEAVWVEFISKLDDNKGDGRTFNLMSLGLIALEMVSPHFRVENFRLVREGGEEFDWMRFRQAVKTLRNDQLREKIWILTSEYPQERLDVFECLNPNFANVNYPRELLLRGTSFAEDLNFM